MTVFWIVAALMAVLALLFVLVPLRHFSHKPPVDNALSQQQASLELHRKRLADLDQQLQSGALETSVYQELRLEVERRLLADATAGEQQKQQGQRITVPVVLALLMPLLAIGLYTKYGAYDLVNKRGALRALAQEQEPEKMLARLEQYVADFPEDMQTRYTLAGIYARGERYDDAAREFRVIVKTVPDQAEPMAQLAQVLFVSQGNTSSDEIRTLVERALHFEPENTTALGLSGVVAYQEERYQDAVSAWTRLLPFTRTPRARAALEKGIARAKAALGEEFPENRVPVISKEKSVEVQVSLDETLAGLPETTRVFIYARTKTTPVPLAIQEMTVADLPATVVLDDSTAMMKGMKLSDQQQVDIVVRLSVSGNAMQPDHESRLENVQVKDTGLSRVIVKADSEV